MSTTENNDGATKAQKKAGPPRSGIIVLVVVLVLAALALGIGFTTSSSATSYACMSLTHQGNDVELATSGIIHESGSQYYIVCPEGISNVNTGITFSCLTITPKTTTYPYPDASTYNWYYLSAPGHTITIPPTATNSSEVLQTLGSSTVVVSC